MDFLKQQLQRFQTEIRTVLAKLTFAQRISVLLLAVVVALSLVVVLLLYTSSESYKLLRSVTEQQDLDALEQLLEENGIPYRVEAGDAGKLRVYVPRQNLSKARWFTMQSGHFNDEKSNFQWLWEEPSLLDNDFREKSRFVDSKKRDLEETLRWSRGIRNVRIVLQKGRKPIYATKTNDNDTALVSLLLAPGVDKLSSREARSIRRAVNGAFNVPLENVQITDDRMNNYPFVETSSMVSSEDNTVQREILSTIERIYSHIFLPSQFVVGVLVDVSQRKSRISKTLYETAVTGASKESTTSEKAKRGPGAAPGVASNVNASGGLGSAPSGASTSEEETRTTKDKEFDLRFPESREETEVPAGEVEGVSVNLVMDEAAVLGILNKEREARKENPLETRQEIDEAVGTYVSKQEESIKKLIPSSFSNAIVHVSTVMFPQPELPPEIGMLGKAGGWFGNHWKDVALVVIALTGIGVAMLILRTTKPPQIEIPSLEESLLVDEDRKNTEEAERLVSELESVRRGHLDPFETDESFIEAQETDEAKSKVAESIALLNELTRAKPDALTKAVRDWIADAVDEEL